MVQGPITTGGISSAAIDENTPQSMTKEEFDRLARELDKIKRRDALGKLVTTGGGIVPEAEQRRRLFVSENLMDPTFQVGFSPEPGFVPIEQQQAAAISPELTPTTLSEALLDTDFGPRRLSSLFDPNITRVRKSDPKNEKLQELLKLRGLPDDLLQKRLPEGMTIEDLETQIKKQTKEKVVPSIKAEKDIAKDIERRAIDKEGVEGPPISEAQLQKNRETFASLSDEEKEAANAIGAENAQELEENPDITSTKQKQILNNDDSEETNKAIKDLGNKQEFQSDNLIKKFRQQYLDNMPEFEGDDKTIMVMNAFLGLLGKTKGSFSTRLAEASKDYLEKVAANDAAKRKYNMLQDQAATRQALLKANEIEKEGRVSDNFYYTGTEPFVYDGRTYQPGDRIKLSRAEQETFPKVGELVPNNDFLQMQKTKAELQKVKLDSLKTNIERLGLTGKERAQLVKDVKTYTEATDTLSTNAEIFALIREMKNSVGKGEVTGFTPQIAKGFARLNALFGKDEIYEEDGKTYDKEQLRQLINQNKSDKEIAGLEKDIKNLDTSILQNDDLNKYAIDANLQNDDGSINLEYLARVSGKSGKSLDKLGAQVIKYQTNAQIIANLMIREILGEGSKNISNIDRQLASEIVGLFSSEKLLVTTKEDLIRRLNYIEGRVEKAYDNAGTLMSTIERNYENKYRYNAGGTLTVQDGVIVDPTIFETDFFPVRQRTFAKLPKKAQQSPDVRRLGSTDPLPLSAFLTQEQIQNITNKTKS